MTDYQKIMALFKKLREIRAEYIKAKPALRLGWRAGFYRIKARLRKKLIDTVQELLGRGGDYRFSRIVGPANEYQDLLCEMSKITLPQLPEEEDQAAIA